MVDVSGMHTEVWELWSALWAWTSRADKQAWPLLPCVPYLLCKLIDIRRRCVFLACSVQGRTIRVNEAQVSNCVSLGSRCMAACQAGWACGGLVAAESQLTLLQCRPVGSVHVGNGCRQDAEIIHRIRPGR
jgi:hypothetical protein